MHCLRFDVPALGVADRNNLFGALEIAESLAGKGVQPIIGVTLAVTEIAIVQICLNKGLTDDLLILRCLSKKTGYDNLMAFISAAHLEKRGHRKPRRGI